MSRYEATGSAGLLDEAFGEAATAIALLRGDSAADRAEVAEMRRLMVNLPEFGRLVSTAVVEAQRSAHEEGYRLWERLGLHTAPPEWEADDVAAARLLVAFACAPLEPRGSAGLRPRLLRLAARRWAEQLTLELCSAEERVWQRALGDRYASVRDRYAPRTSRRTLELSAELTRDSATAAAIREQLSEWLTAGGDLERLSAALEAAFAHARAPQLMA